jgi:hypothetical protein
MCRQIEIPFKHQMRTPGAREPRSDRSPSGAETEHSSCQVGLAVRKPISESRSAVNRPPARIADPDADHLYGRAAGDDLVLCRCEACVDEPRDHGPIESVSEREQVHCNAVRNAREQRQCVALLLAEAWFW